MKPREWYIQEGRVAYAHRRPGDKYELPRVHVIEKSAYDACVKSHDDNVALLKEFQKLFKDAEVYIAELQAEIAQLKNGKI